VTGGTNRHRASLPSLALVDGDLATLYRRARRASAGGGVAQLGEWTRIDPAVLHREDRDEIELWAVTFEADSHEGRNLVLDPRPLVAGQIEAVGPGWRFSLERVNAEMRIPYGPIRHFAFLMVIRSLKHVHIVTYRVPYDEDASARD
jgi:hypothetical protein